MSLFAAPRLATAGFVLLGASIAAPAGAAPAQPDPVTVDFPANTACTFPLTVQVTGGSRVLRTFTDADGNTVRTLSAGTGAALTFSHGAKTVSFMSNGAADHTTLNSDGSTTH